ncbi:MAG: phosphoenolpyruvate carboxykinase domain-containing protein, partial [Candidatus Omnitrophota bacterium]
RPGEKVYVIPFLMGPAHSPFSKVGIQITNSRYVAIEMISMTRVGQEAWEHLGDSDNFVECIHSSGDMDNLSRSNKEDDDRYFAVVRGRKRADGTYDRSKGIAYGSNYGGNVLMGKKHLALRIASLLGVEEGWLAEHMMLLEIKNKETGEVKRVAGAFPSASGKTNLAMLQPPKELAEKYEVTVVGDDILWLRINEEDGRLYAINPENGLFGVLPGTSRAKNPSFVDAIESETGITIFTNPAYNPETGEVWWEGKTKEFPSLEGDGRFWLDWKGRNILERDKELKRQLQAGEISEAQYKEEKSWAQKNSRGTVPAFSVPNLSPDFNNIKGVPIDLVLWGGRISWALEPLIRFMKSPQHGVFDGATTIVEATFAAEGKEGTVREDPMAQRPFFSYNEMKYFKHWLEIVQKLGDKAPAFAHVNWFRRDAAGNFMWPGFGENLRNLLWALEMKERGPEALVQAGKARETPIGFVPTEQGLDLRGLEETVSRETLGEILSFDPELRKKELVRQINYLNALANDAHPVPPEFIRIANETGEALGLGENMWDKASAQSGGEAMASSPLDSSLETVRVALRTNPMTLSLENVSEWLDDFGPESDDPYNVFERVFRETGDHDLANAMASLAGEIAFSHSPDSEESPFSSEDIIHWLTREEGIAQNRPGRSSHGPLDLPSKTPGGINLDPALLDLQIKRDGNGVPLPLLLQPIDQLNIQGFLPVIINITPVTNLPMLLGMAGKGGAPEKETDHRPASPLIEPKAQNYTADNRKVSLLN